MNKPYDSKRAYAVRILSATLVISLLTVVQAFNGRAAPLIRVPNTTLRMPADFPVVGYGVTNAFGDLTFDEPVVIASAPGDTNRLFIVSKTGWISVITNLAAPTKTLFLDASESLVTLSEAGLLGLAFHPGYATNGYFYVYRTISTNLPGFHQGIYDELARYTVDPMNRDRALPESKVRLLMQYDYSSLHNGGDLQFGPDGYLYLSVGDEGPAPGEGESLQAIDRHFFGGILRIDVDRRPGSLPPNPYPGATTNYAIPPDNPFIGRTKHNGNAVDPGKVRTEFYAIGLRNPWRIAFDGANLYCADVGSGFAEEINLIQRGNNYGWPYFEAEGMRLQPPEQPAVSPPLYSYRRGNLLTQGSCVIGGRVYRGQRIPQLNGAYLFGDFVKGRIWAMYREGSTVTRIENITGVPNVSTFGVDPANGDILIASLNGSIVRLIHVDPQTVSVPITLAQTGAFADLTTLSPQPGIVPYEVSVPFWSDNAIKKRWFALPDAASVMGFSATSHWTFPAGAVWIKHFELELTNGVASSRKRIETRFIVKQAAGVYGVTYRWGNSRTNAVLVPEGGLEEEFMVRESGSVRSQTWIYPSRSDCLTCHNPAAGYVLGFNTPQLNCPTTINGGTLNQVEAFASAGYVQAPLTPREEWPSLAHPTNSVLPIHDRVRSYLHANCSACHFPGGLVASWDARITTPVGLANLLDGAVSGPIWASHFRIIKPGDPARSLIPARMSIADYRMPPLGTSLFNDRAIDLLNEYILGIPMPPWQRLDVGATGRAGSSSVVSGLHRVNGSGTNIAGNADAFHFLFQTLTGNVQVVARLASLDASPAHAGIMIRGSTAPDAPFAMLSTGPAGATIYRRHRTDFGAAAGIVDIARPPAYRWWRVVREDNTVRAYASIGGTEWSALGEDTVTFGDQILAGLAVSSSQRHAVAGAAFENVSIVAAHLNIPAAQRSTPLDESVDLRADVVAHGTAIRRVEFYSGEEKIAETLEPPYAAMWRQALEGTHLIRAKVITDLGSVFSEAIAVDRVMPASRLAFRKMDWATRGKWKGAYGRTGMIIVGDVTNLPSHITFSVAGASHKTWAVRTTESRALRRFDRPRRAAAAWITPTNFAVDLNLRDGGLHRVSLYFIDWEPHDRVQFLEIIDSSTGGVLASQTISSFKKGVYFTYAMRGKIQIRLNCKSGSSAVLSAIFIDPVQSSGVSAVKITEPSNNDIVVLPATSVIAASASSADGIEQVEFFVDGSRVGASASAPYAVSHHFAPAGTYAVTARATDRLGEWKLSDPVTVRAEMPAAAAELLWMDTVSQGTWIGAYGSEGFAIPAHATNYPAYVGVDFGIASAHVYFPEGGLRELQTADGSSRIFPVWKVVTPVGLKFLDGSNHVLAAYFVDPEGTRQQQIHLFDGETGAPLWTHNLTSFRDGVYLVWKVRGHVKIQVMAIFGPSTYLGGLFFGSLPDSAPPPTKLRSMGFVDGWMTFSFRRSKLIPNVSWIVETSEDLIQWTPAGGVVSEPVDMGFAEELRLHVPGATFRQRGFYRLRLDEP
jgi:glucose/arabinose dehydrogenase